MTKATKDGDQVHPGSPLTKLLKSGNAFLKGFGVVTQAIVVFGAIILFAIYVLPWLEIAAYGIGLIVVVCGLWFVAIVGLIAFVKWNWKL